MGEAFKGIVIPDSPHGSSKGRAMSVASNQSRNSVFFSSKSYDKSGSCWRRLVQLVQRHDLTANEVVAQWGCETSMSYSEFMRGLVAVLGPNSTAFTHSERKRLFESLKPNRDGRVEIAEFTRRISRAEAAINRSNKSNSENSRWSDVPNPNDHQERSSLVPGTETESQQASLSRSSARDLRMRYRRERLLASNLALRTAMLDRRPTLCCVVPDDAQITSETTVALDRGETAEGCLLIWREKEGAKSVGAELEMALCAPAHGVSGCIVSYGETTPLAFAGSSDGLIWTALRCVYAELELLREDPSQRKDDPAVISIAFESFGLASSLSEKSVHWIVLPERDVETALSQAMQLAAPLLRDDKKKTLVARLKVEDRRYADASAELRVVKASPLDFDEIDLDNVEVWFQPKTASLAQGNRPLSDCAVAARGENSFAYCIVHTSDHAATAQLVELAKRRRCGKSSHAARSTRQRSSNRPAESTLPLEALRRRKSIAAKLKQKESEQQPVTEIISTAVKRVAELDTRLSSPIDENDGDELELLTLSKEHAAKIADACRKHRLAAWECSSRLQAALGRIQVVCRIRPLLGQDSDRGPSPEVKQRTRTTLFVKRSGKGRHVNINLDGHKFASKSRVFEFDDVWDENTSQEEVFESVENLANDALCGRTASVFAYGCTGGGKSYTVVGDLRRQPPRLGLAFQSVELLLASLKQSASTSVGGDAVQTHVRLSMVEVHNEEVYDLLKYDDCSSAEAQINNSHNAGVVVMDSIGIDSPGANVESNLSVAETSSCVSDDALSSISFQTCDGYRRQRRSRPSTGSGDKIKLDVRLGAGGKAHIPELTRLCIDDMAVFLKVFEAGNRRRATTATLLNDASSRSHVVVMVEAPSGGRLCLVDLAGCERVAKSGASGNALKEATAINKSLSALGDCFEAIDKRRTHVPYRNSKLTFMLQDVIGGSASRCLFVFAASPAWATVPETLSSFKFAARMSSIQLDGELLSDKQKQLDLVLSLAGERIERRLLSAFHDELRDIEERSLDKLVRDQEEDAQRRAFEEAALQEAREQPRNESTEMIPSPLQIGKLDGDDATTVEDEKPKPTEAPIDNTGELEKKRVDSELQTLWQRLRATEHELAKLSESQQDPQLLLAPPQKVERPKSLPRSAIGSSERKSISSDEEEHVIRHNSVDVDELSDIEPPPSDEVDYHELRHPSEDIEEEEKEDEPPPPPIAEDEVIVSPRRSGDDVDKILVEPEGEAPVAVKLLYEKQNMRNISFDIVADDAQPPASVFSMFNMLFCDNSTQKTSSTGSVNETPRRRRKIGIGIHQAHGLLPPERDFAARLVGASTNPYVLCKYGEDEQVTKSVSANVDPTWDADVVFRYDHTLPSQIALYLFSTNAYTPDSLLGKVVFDLDRQRIEEEAEDGGEGKPRQILPKSWLPVMPCVEHERNLLKRFERDKAFGIHFRSPRFLYSKRDLGLVQISAYAFTVDT